MQLGVEISWKLWRISPTKNLRQKKGRKLRREKKSAGRAKHNRLLFKIFLLL